MGIFGSKAATGDVGAAPPGRGASSAVGGLSIIGVGMTVRGDIETAGVVKVEGTVDGNVRAKQQVLVAKGGMVHGDIETREAVIGGTADGAIRATERVEIQSGAAVNGDITTRRIAVAEGGSLNGQIRMGDQPAPEHKVVNESKAEPRPGSPPPHARPSVPVARVAVPPRATMPGAGH
ncbi:MAG: polymer-forming cytoskeletal protein [Gemmatimonadetes bacterium]|nr:polymer-forming cytoskeletal protein [Gemmatimonadota bacterium]